MPSFLIPGGGPKEYLALMAALAAGETVRGGKTVLSWREELLPGGHARRVTLFYAPPEASGPLALHGWDLRAWGTPATEVLQFTASAGESRIGTFDE